MAREFAESSFIDRRNGSVYRGRSVSPSFKIKEKSYEFSREHDQLAPIGLHTL